MATVRPPPLIGADTASEEVLAGPYFAGLVANELRVQRCSACDLWTHAPRWRCGQCGSWELGWVKVAGTGLVHSWTRTWHRVATEVTHALPYVTVLVSLPDAGNVRLLGIWIDDGDPVIGQAATVAWGSTSTDANPFALCWTASRDRP